MLECYKFNLYLRDLSITPQAYYSKLEGDEMRSECESSRRLPICAIVVYSRVDM
jgi:hypothetical protein